MASNKLSALSAVSGSLTSDSLIYVADTQDSGSSYSSKKITVANLLSDVASTTDLGTFTGSTISNNQSIKAAIQALETAIETEATNRATAITDLVGGAPGLLDTLNELAAAINDDANFVTTITGLIDDNETHIDNVVSLTGVSKDAANLGTFTGSTISDNQTVKAAIQALETAVEAAGSATSLNAVIQDASDLQTLTGIADGNSNLGTFTGSTIADSVSIKAALQALETALEAQSLSGLGVTASASELNILDGVTATTAELNILDGVTSTAAELNILDGVTATATELNLLDGVTATTAELNYVDGVTSNIQTQLDAKTADGDNVNVLVGTTSAQTVPVDGNGDDNYLFLVVNKSNGALTAIDKTFLETEG